MLSCFIKYVLFSFLEKLMHGEGFCHHSQGCFILPHFCNSKWICPFIECSALRDGNGYMLTCGGWSLWRVIWSVTVDIGVFIVAVLTPPGDCGPIVQRTVEMQSTFLRSSNAKSNRKAVGVLICLRNQCTHVHLSTSMILFWSLHTVLSKKQFQERSLWLYSMQSSSQWTLLLLKGLCYLYHCP